MTETARTIDRNDRIERIELHRIEVPLVRPFETSFGRETVREVLLVRVVTDAAEGWGECVAGRDPFYSGEYVDGAASVIEHYLGPALLGAGGDFGSRRPRSGRLEPLARRSMDRVRVGHPCRWRHPSPRRSRSSPATAWPRPPSRRPCSTPELRAQGRSIGDALARHGTGSTAGSPSASPRPSTRCSTRSPATSKRDTGASSSRSSPDGISCRWARCASSSADDACCRSTRTPRTPPPTSPHLASLDPFNLLLIEQPFAEEDLADPRARSPGPARRPSASTSRSVDVDDRRRRPSIAGRPRS